MESSTPQSAFKHKYAAFGAMGFASIFDSVSKISSSIFGTLTHGVNTTTQADYLSYQSENENINTRRTQSVVTAVVAAAVVAAVAYIILRK